MRSLLSVILTGLLSLTLMGCSPNENNLPATASSEPSDPTSVAASVGAPKEEKIAWFDGSVDEAFAYAKAEGKPIFLYWGAVWCPPCHEIKVTVFDTTQFVERSRLFVPVYLDGDTDNAQKTGEKFGVLGYPTMIVFSPEGVEITRIPGGIDMEAYASVLDLTLQNAKPVSDLLVNVLDQGAQLSAADCALVAFYSWGQNRQILADRDEAEVFHDFYNACPTELAVERSRLYMNYLDKRINAANATDNPLPLSDADKAAGLVEVNKFVGNYAAVKANLYQALLGGPKLVSALTEPGSPDRKSLTNKYINVLNRLAKDDSVFKTERLYTATGKIRFERIDDKEAALSDELIKEIRSLVAWADTSTTDVYERQTVINGAANVLEEAGMTADARVLLTAEIEKSKQPYYFMVSLADIEQADGNYELALSWLKQAYDTATGPATRFQWGNYYFAGLIEMTPEDTDAIRETALKVMAEVGAEGAFYQRNKARLGQMEARLINWNADKQYDDSIEYIRNNVQAMCSNIPAGEASRETCELFLDTA